MKTQLIRSILDFVTLELNTLINYLLFNTFTFIILIFHLSVLFSWIQRESSGGSWIKWLDRRLARAVSFTYTEHTQLHILKRAPDEFQSFSEKLPLQKDNPAAIDIIIQYINNSKFKIQNCILAPYLPLLFFHVISIIFWFLKLLSCNLSSEVLLFLTISFNLICRLNFVHKMFDDMCGRKPLSLHSFYRALPSQRPSFDY